MTTIISVTLLAQEIRNRGQLDKLVAFADNPDKLDAGVIPDVCETCDRQSFSLHSRPVRALLHSCVVVDLRMRDLL